MKPKTRPRPKVDEDYLPGLAFRFADVRLEEMERKTKIALESGTFYGLSPRATWRTKNANRNKGHDTG